MSFTYALCALTVCLCVSVFASDDFVSVQVIDDAHWIIKPAVLKTNLLLSNRHNMSVRRSSVPNGFHSNHSCYDVTFQSMNTQFCFPLISVAGVAKCGTSTLHHMLGFGVGNKFHVPHSKEQCNYLFVEIVQPNLKVFVNLINWNMHDNILLFMFTHIIIYLLFD
jgi:hypothetical protein